MTGLQDSKCSDLFDRYKYDEITFSGTVLKSSGIIERDIYLKAGSSQWPCTIISASMMGIKVSISLSAEAFSAVSDKPGLQVHFSFMGLKPYFIPISFFLSYRITELTNISNMRGGNHLLTMINTSSPPDSFIRILGELIGIQTLTTKRAETRITVNAATAEDLGLKSTHCRMRINDTWQDCFLQDLSFSGCQVYLNSRISITNKKVFLEILFRDPDIVCEIPGNIIRFTVMKESGDKASAGLRFEGEQIPHEYFMKLHNILD